MVINGTKAYQSEFSKAGQLAVAIGGNTARTKGHGNPDWTRDETILALALYFECGEKVPSRHDPRIGELSTLLRRMPYHAEAARKATFRNSDGVGFKLQNLRSVATGKGLGNTSKLDREIWAEFGAQPSRTIAAANFLRTVLNSADSSGPPSDHHETEEFFEGRLLTMTHNSRERHPGLRRSLLEARSRVGRLRCDICCFEHRGPMRELDDAPFEGHHLLPLSSAIERKTRIEDMALLCANCHRLVHRLIIIEKRWLSISECRVMLMS